MSDTPWRCYGCGVEDKQPEVMDLLVEQDYKGYTFIFRSPTTVCRCCGTRSWTFEQADRVIQQTHRRYRLWRISRAANLVGLVLSLVGIVIVGVRPAYLAVVMFCLVPAAAVTSIAAWKLQNKVCAP